MGKTLPILLVTAVLAGVSFSIPASAKNNACQAAVDSAVSDELRTTHGRMRRDVPVQMGRLVKQAMNDAGCKNPTLDVFIPKGGLSNAANRVRWQCDVSGPPFHVSCTFGNI